MASFTTQVRTICENLTGRTESTGFEGINALISEAVPLVFDFEFPIYDESYRNVLCSKILKHYFTREIGAETYAQWKLWLDVRLNEIMPYYNQLYKSALLEFNPLYDVDITTKRNNKVDGTTDVTDKIVGKDSRDVKRNTSVDNTTTNNNSSQGSNSANDMELFSDTPQGTLDGVESGNYLTNAKKNTNSGSYNDTNSGTSKVIGTGTDNSTDVVDKTSDKTGKTVVATTEDYLETVKGKNGGASYAKMLMEYRKTFINIDTQIINDLSDLFFTLW